MYETHWGLIRSPFRGLADPQFFYGSPTHEEALARLAFLVENRRRLGLLLGEPGSGKTLVLKVLAKQLAARGSHVACVNLLSLGARDLLCELAAQLHGNPRADQTPFQLWRTITDRLTENQYQQLSTVVLLDDADEVDRDLLGHLVRLVRHDPRAESALTVVLALDPQALPRLGRRLWELAELRIDLERWSPEDTQRYLCASLAKAGASHTVFAADAASRLHQLARGVPRQVSNLAQLALLAGAGEQLPQIDAATVQSVYDELALTR
jgi:type II secretory pathway predicted ATPase ExeA